MSTFRCPSCDGKIKQKNYDEVFEWYECPGCESCFTFDELLEGGGAAVAKDSRRTEIQDDKPVAKAKKKKADYDEAVKKADRASLRVEASGQPESRKHRDEIPTGQVLNIMADEIEILATVLGGSVNRANAREFYAMNLWRPVRYELGISAREQEVPHVLCGEHS